jgi:hypothetical protein
MCMIASGQEITLTSLERLRGLKHTIDMDLTVSGRIPDSEPL